MDFLNVDNMNWLVAALLATAITNIVSGYKKGFIKELINCLSLLVLSVVVVLLAAVMNNYADKQFMQMLTVIIMLFILIIGYNIVKKVLSGAKLLTSLPVISVLNKLAGGIFGVLETVVFVWFVFCLLGLFDLGAINEYIHPCIQENSILTYLYNNNLVAILGEKIMGEEFQLKALDMILNQDIVENILK